MKQALQSARDCYTPYTRCPAGMALITEAGIYSGGVIESCAYNPTINPLQAACITMATQSRGPFTQVCSLGPYWMQTCLHDAPTMKATPDLKMLPICHSHNSRSLLHVSYKPHLHSHSMMCCLCRSVMLCLWSWQEGASPTQRPPG